MATTAAPSGGSTPTAADYGIAAKIPAWQVTELTNLANQGLLSGVNPAILAAIDQAESSGAGGGINPSGYGGWFGLGVGSKYPAGSPTAALLSGTDPATFDTQAELAASEFSSLLGRTGGNVYSAESAYQGGSAEGTAVFAADRIPTTDTGTAPAATLTSINVGGIVQGAVNAVAPGAGDVLGLLSDVAGGALTGAWKSALKVVLEGVFVLAALALMLMGIARVFHPKIATQLASSLPLTSMLV